MAQSTYLVRKDEDADLGALTCDSLVVNTTPIEAGAVTLADDELITAGTGSDVTMEWDTAASPDQFQVAAAADDTIFSFGVSAATQKSFDLKWFANEAAGASYLYFDASANLIYTTGVDLQFKDDDVLVFGTGSGATGDVQMTYDADSLNLTATGASEDLEIGADSHVINTTILGTLTVGVDDTGYDVQLFGASTGCSLLWDESEDQLVLTGPADVPVFKVVGAGSFSGATYETAGTAWATDGTPAFNESQKYLKIDYDGTTYRIPVWADS